MAHSVQRLSNNLKPLPSRHWCSSRERKQQEHLHAHPTELSHQGMTGVDKSHSLKILLVWHRGCSVFLQSFKPLNCTFSVGISFKGLSLIMQLKTTGGQNLTKQNWVHCLCQCISYLKRSRNPTEGTMFTTSFTNKKYFQCCSKFFARWHSSPADKVK